MNKTKLGVSVLVVALSGCGGGLPRDSYEIEEGASCEYRDDTTSGLHTLRLEGSVRIIEPAGDSNADGCTDVIQISTGRSCEMCAVVNETGGWRLVARHLPGTVEIPDCVLSDGTTSLEGTELFESSIRELPDGRLGIYISYISMIREGSTVVDTGAVQCNFNASLD